MDTAHHPAKGTPHHLAAAAGALLLAALATGCASTLPTSSTDYGCTEWHMVPITVNGQVHLVRGHCRAWNFGPTPKQLKDFDERAQRQGGVR